MDIPQSNQGCDSNDQQLAEAMEAYLAELKSGATPDMEAFARRYGDIADDLRGILPGLEIIHGLLAPAEDAGQQRESDPLRPLATLGDYRIVRELGRGGMGVVYEAEQLSLGRTVALKILPFAGMLDERQLIRFKNEARAAATLNHPNIVPVQTVGCERGVHFIAMQMIQGQSLASVIGQLRQMEKSGDLSSVSDLQDIPIADATSRATNPNNDQWLLASDQAIGSTDPTIARSTSDQPSTAPDTQRDAQAGISTQGHGRGSEFYRSVARLGIQAADGLEHAHSRGVLHRDIKPANLMLDGSGKLWITDFGLARIEGDVGVSVTGDFLGTIRYMPPERAGGQRQVADPRTDIYSLGVTLYELLTLRPAFEGDDQQRLLARVTADEPVAPRRIDRSIPVELETIVLTAMAKQPEERYATAQQLADDLQAFLNDEPIKAKPPTLPQRIVKWSRRHKPLVASAAVFLLISTIGLAVSNVLIAQQHTVAETAAANETAQRKEADKQRAVAERQKTIADENFKRAREAVDEYLTKVSEDKLLNTPGLQPLRKDLLELALKYYQQFIAERSDDPDLQTDLANAYYRVGEITAEIASTKDALKAHQKALDIRKALAVRNTGNEDDEDNLVESYRAVGLLQKKTGNRVAALNSYDQAKRIALRLVNQHANVPKYREEVGHIYRSLGSLYGDTRNLSEAENSIRLAIQVWKTLAAEHPDQGDYFNNLGNSYNSLGFLQHSMDEQKEAIASCRKGDAIYQQLVKEHPTVSKYWASLATFHNNFGLLLKSTGKPDEGLASLRKSVEIRAQLVAKNPSVLAYQSSLANSYNNLGVVLRSARDYSGALAALQKAVTAFNTLLVMNPSVVVYQDGAANSFNNLGNLQKTMGNYDDALDSYASAITIRTRIVAQNPRILEHQSYLARHYNNLGLLQRTIGKPKEALASFRKAFEIYDSLVKASPESVYQAGLANAYHNVALMYEAEGHLAKAIASQRKSVSIQEELAAKHPTVTKYQSRLSTAYLNMGSMLAASGKQEEALKLVQKAIGLQEKRMFENPHAHGLQPKLAALYNSAGSLQRDSKKMDEALVSFRNAIKIRQQIASENPSIPDDQAELAGSFNNLGTLQKVTGDFDGALTSYKRAIEINRKVVKQHPSVPKYRSYLGNHFINMGELQELDGKPSDANTLYLQALKVRKQLVAENPGDIKSQLRLADVHRRLGELQRGTGKREQAHESFERAVTLLTAIPEQTRPPVAWSLFGRTLYRTGRWKEASHALRQANERYGEDSPTLTSRWWYLTMALAQLGETDKARSYYDHLVAELATQKNPSDQYDKLRDETAELLGIPKTPTEKPGGKEDNDSTPPNESGTTSKM